MKASLSEIRRSLPSDKTASWWVRLWVRRAAHRVTWVALRLGLTANQVSLLSILVVVVGSVFLGLPTVSWRVTGAILINSWLVLDCVDGDLARLLGTASPAGEFMDALAGYYAVAAVYVGIGFGTWQYTGEQKWVVVGMATSLLCLLSRLISLKAHLISSAVRSSGNMQLGTAIIENLEISGLLMPLLFIGTVRNLLHWVIAAYCGFWTLALIAVSVLSVQRATRPSR